MEALNNFELKVLNILGCESHMNVTYDTVKVVSDMSVATVFREAQRTWWVYSSFGHDRFTSRAGMFAWLLKVVVL